MKHIGIEHYGFKIVLFSAVIIHFLASMILEVRHSQPERGFITKRAVIIPRSTSAIIAMLALLRCIPYASVAVLLNLSNIGAL